MIAPKRLVGFIFFRLLLPLLRCVGGSVQYSVVTGQGTCIELLSKEA